MRKLFATLALLFVVSLPVQAQSNKFDFHYNATLLGASRIDDVDGSYNSIGAAFKNQKFMFTVNPVVLQWNDSTTRFSSEIEAAVRIMKKPLWLGVGRSLSTKHDNHTYGRLSYGGDRKFPFLFSVGAGRDFFTTSFAIQIKH